MSAQINTIWTPEFQDEIDAQFIMRVQREVTQSCALPFVVPAERIPEFITQSAQFWWENSDQAVEERNYVIRNRDICKGNSLNKIIKLPSQIISVFGVHKVQDDLKYGAMGDFSIERMLMSSYSMFGGAGIIGGGLGLTGGTGYTLPDVMMSLYEVDQFDQFLNPPISYNFNSFSSDLVLLGDLGRSDLIIQCFKRVRLHDLYNSYYFFRTVVCFCKRALSTIYGTFEFKLPGEVTINYSNFSDQAENELDKIEEWIQNHNAIDYFFQPKMM